MSSVVLATTADENYVLVIIIIIIIIITIIITALDISFKPSLKETIFFHIEYLQEHLKFA